MQQLELPLESKSNEADVEMDFRMLCILLTLDAPCFGDWLALGKGWSLVTLRFDLSAANISIRFDMIASAPCDLLCFLLS